MEYEIDQKNEILIDGNNSLEKVKKAITDLIDLNDTEKEVIESIKDLKQLESLFVNPKAHLTEANATKLSELKETYDLIGGLYFA